ncbi:thiamine phosphate synthase [Candidatus Omnitrophota bacterium]
MEKCLYFVTGEEYSDGRNTLDVAVCAISGGIDVLQMREKDKTAEELKFLGRRLSDLCRKNGVTFIVNDDPYLAKEVAASGVHLGQQDLEKYPIGKARGILGKNRIIGVSTHSVEEFEAANKEECDYIAFGPIFPTKSKDYSIGTSDIKRVLEVSKKPVVFIGGINKDNVSSLLEEGVSNIAVIRAITQAANIIAEARNLKDKIKDQ